MGKITQKIQTVKGKISKSLSVIERKINTFRSYPFHSTITILFIPFKYIYNKWGKFRLRQYIHLFQVRPPEAIQPDYSDLWFLYKIVRKRKPKVILEFGSGCSTVIFAQALKDNGSGFLYSLDSDPDWAKVTSQCIPSSLKSFCEIQYSPAIETQFEIVSVFRHTNVPQINCDMLYLDGPSLNSKTQVTIDPLDIEHKFSSAFFMIVDGRRINVDFLRKYLKKRYRFKHNWILFNSTFELIK